jgi:hypothetical protein
MRRIGVIDLTKTMETQVRVILLICAVLLVGCQPAYLKDGRPNENSPYFEIPVGSKFVLHQTLTIRPYSRNVFFQNGRALPFFDVNEFIDYCALTLYAQKQAPQTVKPDTFTVTKVYREYLYQLASAPVVLAQMFQDKDGDTWHVLATQMELQAKDQPDVIRLTCAAWGLPQDISNVTLAGIRKSLGDVATLELADSKAPGAGGSGGQPRRQGTGY